MFQVHNFVFLFFFIIFQTVVSLKYYPFNLYFVYSFFIQNFIIYYFSFKIIFNYFIIYILFNLKLWLVLRFVKQKVTLQPRLCLINLHFTTSRRGETNIFKPFNVLSIIHLSFLYNVLELKSTQHNKNSF